jgi:hypothetical protein
MRGKSPSNINTKAIAARIALQKDTYFLGVWGAAAAGAGVPRMVLKKSLPLGSSTMTSLFLAKLALYASKLL